MIRQEQCDKVCRILDDVLSNRPTERDALIVAVRTAFDELKERKKGRWIPCSERLSEAEVLCCDIRGEMIIGYPYQDDESETGYSAVSDDDDVYMIDCIAWMEKPEPYREGET